MATITTDEVAKIFAEILPKLKVPGKWEVRGREYFGVDGNGKKLDDHPARVCIELIHVPTGFVHREFVVPEMIPSNVSKQKIKESLMAFGVKLHAMKPEVERRAWAAKAEKDALGITDQGMSDLTKRSGQRPEGN